MCKDPVSVLKRVRVEDGELPLGGFADVGDDGFRRDDARYTAKKDIGDRGFGGLDDVGRTRDVVSYAPSIGMALTLPHQRIFGMKKTVVNLAFDHGAESKQSAHRLIPSQTSMRCKVERPRCPTPRCLAIGSTIPWSRQLLGRSRCVCIARVFGGQRMFSAWAVQKSAEGRADRARAVRVRWQLRSSGREQRPSRWDREEADAAWF